MFKEDRFYLIDIGLECADIRKKAGLTMKELGKLFGVGEYTIANFEYGKINNAVLYKKYLKLENGDFN